MSQRPLSAIPNAGEFVQPSLARNLRPASAQEVQPSPPQYPNPTPRSARFVRSPSRTVSSVSKDSSKTARSPKDEGTEVRWNFQGSPKDGQRGPVRKFEAAGLTVDLRDDIEKPLHELYLEKQGRNRIDLEDLSLHQQRLVWKNDFSLRQAIHGSSSLTPAVPSLDLQLGRAGLKTPLQLQRKKFDILISCNHLTRRSKALEADPFCVVFAPGLLGASAGDYTEIFRSERVTNNVNPIFQKELALTYKGKIEPQWLKFAIYDDQDFLGQSTELRKEDELGWMECTLEEIITASEGEAGALTRELECHRHHLHPRHHQRDRDADPHRGEGEEAMLQRVSSADGRPWKRRHEHGTITLKALSRHDTSARQGKLIRMRRTRGFKLQPQASERARRGSAAADQEGREGAARGSEGGGSGGMRAGGGVGETPRSTEVVKRRASLLLEDAAAELMTPLAKGAMSPLARGVGVGRFGSLAKMRRGSFSGSFSAAATEDYVPRLQRWLGEWRRECFRLFPKFVVREAYKDFQKAGRQNTLDLVEYLALLAAAGTLDTAPPSKIPRIAALGQISKTDAAEIFSAEVRGKAEHELDMDAFKVCVQQIADKLLQKSQGVPEAAPVERAPTAGNSSRGSPEPGSAAQTPLQLLPPPEPKRQPIGAPRPVVGKRELVGGDPARFRLATSKAARWVGGEEGELLGEYPRGEHVGSPRPGSMREGGVRFELGADGDAREIRVWESAGGAVTPPLSARTPGTAVTRTPGTAVMRTPGTAVMRTPGTAVMRTPGTAVMRTPGGTHTSPLSYAYSRSLPRYLGEEDDEPLPQLRWENEDEEGAGATWRGNKGEGGLSVLKKGPEAHGVKSKELMVHDFAPLLDVAANSLWVQVQQQAAPAVSALALSSGATVAAFGGVGVMIQLFKSAENAKVQADALEALASLTRKSTEACEIFLEADGLELAFGCRKSSSTLVRRKGLELVEAALLGQAGDMIKDRFSNRNLLGLVKYIGCPDPVVGEAAGKLISKLTSVALVQRTTWEPMKAAGLTYREMERKQGGRVQKVTIAAESLPLSATGLLSRATSQGSAPDSKRVPLARADSNAVRAMLSVWTAVSARATQEAWIRAEVAEAGRDRSGRQMPRGRLLAVGKGKVKVVDKSVRDDASGTKVKGFRVDLRGEVRGGFREVSNALLEAMARMMGGTKEGEHCWMRVLAIQSLLLEGLVEALGQQLQTRGPAQEIQEEDCRLVRCLELLGGQLEELAEGCIPPEYHHTVAEMLSCKSVKPLLWMNAEEIEALTSMCALRRFSKGQIVVRQGDRGSSCFVVLSGSVSVLFTSKLNRRMKELTVMSAGDMFGEANLFHGVLRASTVMATEDTQLVEMSQQAMASVAARRPELWELVQATQMEAAENEDAVLHLDDQLSEQAKEEALKATARACTWSLVSGCMPALRVVLEQASTSTEWGWRPRGSAADEAQRKDEVVRSGLAVVCGWVKLGLAVPVAKENLVPMMVPLMRAEGREEKEWEKGLGGRVTEAMITLWEVDGARDHVMQADRDVMWLVTDCLLERMIAKKRLYGARVLLAMATAARRLDCRRAMQSLDVVAAMQETVEEARTWDLELPEDPDISGESELDSKDVALAALHLMEALAQPPTDGSENERGPAHGDGQVGEEVLQWMDAVMRGYRRRPWQHVSQLYEAHAQMLTAVENAAREAARQARLSARRSKERESMEHGQASGGGRQGPARKRGRGNGEGARGSTAVEELPEWWVRVGRKARALSRRHQRRAEHCRSASLGARRLHHHGSARGSPPPPARQDKPRVNQTSSDSPPRRGTQAVSAPAPPTPPSPLRSHQPAPELDPDADSSSSSGSETGRSVGVLQEVADAVGREVEESRRGSVTALSLDVAAIPRTPSCSPGGVPPQDTAPRQPTNPAPPSSPPSKASTQPVSASSSPSTSPRRSSSDKMQPKSPNVTFDSSHDKPSRKPLWRQGSLRRTELRMSALFSEKELGGGSYLFDVQLRKNAIARYMRIAQKQAEEAWSEEAELEWLTESKVHPGEDFWRNLDEWDRERQHRERSERSEVLGKLLTTMGVATRDGEDKEDIMWDIKSVLSKWAEEEEEERALQSTRERGRRKLTVFRGELQRNMSFRSRMDLFGQLGEGSFKDTADTPRAGGGRRELDPWNAIVDVAKAIRAFVLLRSATTPRHRFQAAGKATMQLLRVGRSEQAQALMQEMLEV